MFGKPGLESKYDETAAREFNVVVCENAMKFGVGVMLPSFGIFWGAEGAGAHWQGGDAALLVIVPTVLAFSLALVQLFRVSPADGQTARA